VNAGGDSVGALRALARRLAVRFPELPLQAVAAAASEAWQAAQLIGVDTVDTVGRLAREQLRCCAAGRTCYGS
jgi:hypothetical protein